LPQGCAKKIELQLLLADLALQPTDALARRRKVVRALKIERPMTLTRPARRPQRILSARSVTLAPLVNVPARHPKMTRERLYALPR
jgi:hypothetical protein